MRVLVDFVNYESNDSYDVMVLEIEKAFYVKSEGDKEGRLVMHGFDTMGYTYQIDNVKPIVCSMICHNLMEYGFYDLTLYGKCHVVDMEEAQDEN